MEYINGPTLREYRKKNSPTLEEVIELFQQLCSVVIHLHLSKLYHRDIKPEIIRYSAPDYLLFLNEERCDDYSVGAVLYFLIYGYDIFSHEPLFSRLIFTISSEEVTFDIPKCINTKNWCVLLEISRELLEKESEYRLSLPKALEESKLLENGDLWKEKIIPLVYYRVCRAWDHPNIKRLDPSYVIELFPDSIGIEAILECEDWLPPEYYDVIIKGLTDEGWIHLYCNIDLINTLQVIPNINEFISFNALGMSFAEWEQAYLKSSSDKEKVILLRTLTCQYMLNDFSLQDYYRLIKKHKSLAQ